MKKVKMYTLSTCPHCMKTKKFFSDRKVKFEAVDYDLADDAMQQKIQKELKARGFSSLRFPCVMIGDEIVTGYDPEKFEELLK